jgi:hypothetical protein
MSEEKNLGDIGRAEWVAFEWREITEYGQEERRFLKGRFRTPDEGARAADDWDKWFPSAWNYAKKTSNN